MKTTNTPLLEWQPIDTAPKGATKENPAGQCWILGCDGRCGEMRVMRWCMEYPSKGEWMFAYEPNEYIAGIQSFEPTHWMPLPSPPIGSMLSKVCEDLKL